MVGMPWWWFESHGKFGKKPLKKQIRGTRNPWPVFSVFPCRFHTYRCSLFSVLLNASLRPFEGIHGLVQRPRKTGDMFFFLQGVGGVRLCHEVLTTITMISGVFLFVWFLSVGFGTLRWNLTGKCEDRHFQQNADLRKKPESQSPVVTSPPKITTLIISSHSPFKFGVDHSQNHGLTCHWCNRFHLRFCPPKKTGIACEQFILLATSTS